MISEREREKYSRIWQIPSYSKESPGLQHVDMFAAIAKPIPGQSVADVGAGDGAASNALRDRLQLRVTAFDLTNTAWKGKPDIPLHLGSVWRGVPGGMFDHVYCCDMMEHIPTELVALAVDRILMAGARCFFSISFLPDAFGAFIGEPLHLTVRPFTWWRDLFREIGRLDEARDMMGEGVFVATLR